MKKTEEYRLKYPKEIYANVLRFVPWGHRTKSIVHRQLVAPFFQAIQFNCRSYSNNLYLLMMNRWCGFFPPVEVIAPILRESNNDADSLQLAFSRAVLRPTSNSIKIIKLLLVDNRVDPSKDFGIVRGCLSHAYSASGSLKPNFAIRYAASIGCNEVVAMLLRHKLVDPSAFDNQAIKRAANIEILRLLLADKRVDPSVNDGQKLVGCADMHKWNEVMLLLSDKRVDPSAQNNRVLELAAANNQPQVIQRLLRDKRVTPSPSNNEAFFNACKNGHAIIVDRLLADKRVRTPPNNPQFNPHDLEYHLEWNLESRLEYRLGHSLDYNPQYNPHFQDVFASHNPDVVKMLLKDSRFDPSLYGNAALISAAKQGNTESVKLLLADPRVQPTIKQASMALKQAPAEGYGDIVDLLLKDGRAHPSLVANAFEGACRRGHTNVVRRLLRGKRIKQYGGFPAATVEVTKLLLTDPRFCPNLSNIDSASQSRDIELLRLFLSDKRVNPADGDNKVLLLAIKAGDNYSDVVKLLLTDRRVDPRVPNNQPLVHAANYGENGDCLKLLLKDGRADPTARNNTAIRQTAQLGRLGRVKLLLEDGRVDPSANNNEAIREAKKAGHTQIVKLLEKYQKAGFPKRRHRCSCEIL